MNLCTCCGHVACVPLVFRYLLLWTFEAENMPDFHHFWQNKRWKPLSEWIPSAIILSRVPDRKTFTSVILQPETNSLFKECAQLHSGNHFRMNTHPWMRRCLKSIHAPILDRKSKWVKVYFCSVGLPNVIGAADCTQEEAITCSGMKHFFQPE